MARYQVVNKYVVRDTSTYSLIAGVEFDSAAAAGNFVVQLNEAFYAGKEVGAKEVQDKEKNATKINY